MKSLFQSADRTGFRSARIASALPECNRRGASVWAVVLTLALVSIPAAIWSPVTDWFSGEPAPDYLTAEVTIGPFVHDVVEHGEIESSSNVEVRCGVRSRSSSGINILEIVPEGSRVEAGDFLVKLDDAALQTELIQQQIVVTNSQAQVIEAKAAFDSAGLALKECATVASGHAVNHNPTRQFDLLRQRILDERPHDIGREFVAIRSRFVVERCRLRSRSNASAPFPIPRSGRSAICLCDHERRAMHEEPLEHRCPPCRRVRPEPAEANSSRSGPASFRFRHPRPKLTRTHRVIVKRMLGSLLLCDAPRSPAVSQW